MSQMFGYPGAIPRRRRLQPLRAGGFLYPINLSGNVFQAFDGVFAGYHFEHLQSVGSIWPSQTLGHIADSK